MGITLAAQHFGALHVMGRVSAFIHRVGIQRHKKTGPAAAAVVFTAGLKQWLTTTGAHVLTGLSILIERTTKRRFGTLFAGDAIDLWAQLLQPLLVGFCYLFHCLPISHLLNV